MTETNLVQVVSTHASTSQADVSDYNSSIFSFSVTTPTVDFSDNSEWKMILSGASIQEILIMCARTGTDFLALRTRWMFCCHG